MPISSVVITCDQGQSELIAAKISAISGVEVRGVLPDGQVIALIEADSVQEEVDPVSDLNGTSGVIAVRMAYHNFEDLAEV